MLLALNLPLPQQLLAHSHWTVDQRKMSKSIGNVADPLQAIDEFGLDIVRYYLARVGGRFKDDVGKTPCHFPSVLATHIAHGAVDWSREQLDKHSKEITSLLGNLLLRITSKKIEHRVSEHKASSISSVLKAVDGNHPAYKLSKSMETLNSVVDNNMQKLLVADSLEAIISILQEVWIPFRLYLPGFFIHFFQANLLMTRTAPWSPRTPTDTVVEVHAIILECLRISGISLQPFIPEKAARLLDALGVHDEQRSLEFAALGKGSIGEVQSGVRLFDRPLPTS